ncbi:hypothetical protein FAI41_05830 [Acetobacteraceae bacterium]|nr:hypothetical protein FAI41_05830 [Acetobacteraceae bacterium]
MEYKQADKLLMQTPLNTATPPKKFLDRAKEAREQLVTILNRQPDRDLPAPAFRSDQDKKEEILREEKYSQDLQEVNAIHINIYHIAEGMRYTHFKPIHKLLQRQPDLKKSLPLMIQQLDANIKIQEDIQNIKHEEQVQQNPTPTKAGNTYIKAENIGVVGQIGDIHQEISNSSPNIWEKLLSYWREIPFIYKVIVVIILAICIIYLNKNGIPNWVYELKNLLSR